MHKDDEPRLPHVGITLGDLNGIGPEVTLKALADARLLSYLTPVIYGSPRVVAYFRNHLGLESLSFTDLKPDSRHLKPGRIYVATAWEDQVTVAPGTADPAMGKYAFLALEAATAGVASGLLDAVVTAPIAKNHMPKEDFDFPGHTEYFGKKFGGEEPLMMMVSETLRLGLVTTHMPLKDVAQAITPQLVEAKLLAMERSLQHDFGIVRPKIGVLGLNPHAGESGTMGKEEKSTLMPLLDRLRDEGKLFYGPYPADGFFGAGTFAKFDGVMAMYHDQGLIPFKTLAMSEGVNYTAGLNGVRTSPDHGTAFDIAGGNKADATSMIQSLLLARDVVKNRREAAALEQA